MHDARKLSVMHQLDPAGTLELCKTALEDGSPEVKAAAIGCLGKHEDCLPLLLEGKRVFDSLLKGEAELVSRLTQILDCIGGRNDAEVEEFLLTCLSQCD